MDVQLTIPYETLIDLVAQLPKSQQEDLIRRIQNPHEKQPLTADEKMARLRAVQIDAVVNTEPSVRREA